VPETALDGTNGISGLFVLLKLKLALPYPEFRKIHSLVLLVRTFV